MIVVYWLVCWIATLGVFRANPAAGKKKIYGRPPIENLRAASLLRNTNLFFSLEPVTNDRSEGDKLHRFSCIILISMCRRLTKIQCDECRNSDNREGKEVVVDRKMVWFVICCDVEVD